MTAHEREATNYQKFAASYAMDARYFFDLAVKNTRNGQEAVAELYEVNAVFCQQKAAQLAANARSLMGV